MMRVSSLLLAGIFALGATVANAAWDSCTLPNVDWVTYDSAKGQSMAYGLAMDTDGIWLAGTFRDTLTIRGPSHSVTHTSAFATTDPSNDDVYIAKLGLNGNPILVHPFEGIGRQVFIDATRQGNNLYIVGYFLGELAMKSGTTLVNNKPQGSGHTDIVVASIDISSTPPTVNWAISYANEHTSRADSIAVDAAGNVVIAGSTCVAGDPNPQTGLATSVCSGLLAVFSAADGTKLREFKQQGYTPSAVQSDGSEIYFAASLSAASFTLGGITVTKVGTADIMIGRFNSETGTVSWLKSSGVSGQSLFAHDLVIGDNHIYVAGGESGKTFDGFLLKAAKSDGTAAYRVNLPYARGITLSQGETFVYLMGMFAGELVFSSSLTLQARASYDLFLLKVSASNGAGEWAMNVGAGDGLEYPWTMTKDTDGNLYMSGLTGSTNADFGKVPFVDTSVLANNLYVSKVLAQEQMPSCLASCSNPSGDFCFIGNTCVPKGAANQAANKQCFTCDTAKSKTAWSGPDTSSHCYIEGACVPTGRSRDNSRCQVCDATKKTTEWSLKAGFKLAADGKTCQSDGSLPDDALLPGCASGHTFNENYCGSVTPCYDAGTDKCFAAVNVCAAGQFFTSDCPEYPRVPCYDISKHTCVPPSVTGNSGDNGPYCGNTGEYIYVSQCPSTHPCYDVINRYCTEASVKTSAAADTSAGPQALLFAALSTALAATLA